MVYLVYDVYDLVYQVGHTCNANDQAMYSARMNQPSQKYEPPMFNYITS